ncbi:hypothetical protein [Rhizobium mesoamericanum]|nr:hypothetical protein [Rhizobium mesoamericanum]
MHHSPKLARAEATCEKLAAALDPLRQGISASEWHNINGERMKRILVAETAIERIDEALSLAKLAEKQKRENEREDGDAER